jgi:hypothetical protein
MTKSAPSHTRGKLKHFVIKPCQNHSILEQLWRILKQNRAKLRLPGFQWPQCPDDNPPSLGVKHYGQEEDLYVPPRETHALTASWKMLRNAHGMLPNAAKCDHLLTPHGAGAHVISFGIIYLPARAITSPQKAEKRQQMLATAQRAKGLSSNRSRSSSATTDDITDRPDDCARAKLRKAKV